MADSPGQELTRRQANVVQALEDGAAALKERRGDTRAPLDAIDQDLVTVLGTLRVQLNQFAVRAVTGQASRAEWSAIAECAEQFVELLHGGMPPEDRIIDGEPQTP